MKQSRSSTRSGTPKNDHKRARIWNLVSGTTGHHNTCELKQSRRSTRSGTPKNDQEQFLEAVTGQQEDTEQESGTQSLEHTISNTQERPRTIPRGCQRDSKRTLSKIWHLVSEACDQQHPGTTRNDSSSLSTGQQEDTEAVTNEHAIRNTQVRSGTPRNDQERPDMIRNPQAQLGMIPYSKCL